ncbi:uncharacterized protein [Notamacropus eugenii]|uniref:uncharacterized protein isoform X2 n=1 Tax=Notamacropus eugenii TaxID=9315 RepID=UPI003B67C017
MRGRLPQNSSMGSLGSGEVRVSELRVRGRWDTGVSSVLSPPDPLSQKPEALSGTAKDAPLGGPGPSCHQEQYIWRLTHLLGSVPLGGGELSPCSSDSICTEDFAAHFQEAMVGAGLPEEGQEEVARSRSPESLGGHISRVSQGSPALNSRSHQQATKEKGAAKCSWLIEDPSPRLGPSAPGTSGGRSLSPSGDPFPEKQRPKRDSGMGRARSQSGSPEGPSLHIRSRSPRLPPPPSAQDKGVHWDQEPPLNLLPHGPTWEGPGLRQFSRPLAGEVGSSGSRPGREGRTPGPVPFSSGPRNPRLSRKLPTPPWDSESLSPSCLLGYRSLSSHKMEPSLSHRKGLEKEQKTLGDPKPWKWNNKPERMKESSGHGTREEMVAGGTPGKETPLVCPQDGGPGQLGVMEAMKGRHKVARAKSGTSEKQQRLMTGAPASVEAPRPGSPGLGLALLEALIEAARRRLWDVHQQAESLGEAVRKLQSDRLASVPGGCQGPEASVVDQEYYADGGADEETEIQRRRVTRQRPRSLAEWLLGPRGLGSRKENSQPWVCPQHPPACPGKAHSQRFLQREWDHRMSKSPQG